MDSTFKRPLLRWLIRLSLGGAACLLGVAIGILVGRKEIANRIAHHYLGQAGLDQASLQVASLERDHCELAGLEIATDSATLNIDSIKATYDLSEAWKTHRLRRVQIDGVQLRYDLTGPSTFEPQAWDDLIKQGIPFPLERLEIDRAQIELLMDFGTIAFEVNLAFWLEAASKIQGSLIAYTPDESVDMEFSIEDTLDFQANASVNDLLPCLKRYGIDVEDYIILPEGSDLQAQNLALQTTGSFHGIQPQRIEFETRIGPVRIQDLQSDIAFDTIEAQGVWQGGALRKLSASLQIDKAQIETMRIGQSLVAIESKDLENWTAAMSETSWSANESLSGRLSMNAGLILSESNALENLRATLSLPQLNYDDIALEPFTLSLSGSLDRLEIISSRLASPQFPWLRLEPIQIDLAAIADPDAKVSLLTTLASPESCALDSKPPIEGSWALATSFEPNRDPQVFSLSLKPSSAEQLFKTDAIQAVGDGRLEIEARHWPQRGELDASLSASAMNLEIESPTASGSGLNLSAFLKSEAIPVERLWTALADSSRNELAQLVKEYASYHFNAQGAQADIGDSIALQWFAAGLSSTETVQTEKPISAQLNANIGIANAAQESLQQITLDGSLETNLEELSFQADGEFLFEGEPARFSVNQDLKFANSGLEVEGDYAIQNIRLINSDLLSRYSPSLIGSATSANIDVQGEIRLGQGTLSVPAAISISDGSLIQSANDVSLESIQSEIAFESLWDIATLPSQAIRIESLQIGDIDASDLQVAFQLDRHRNLIVEIARVQTFDGILALEPFSLSLEDPQAALTLTFERISVAPAIAMLDFFDGNVTGRLNGSLPISIVDGLPVLGEGFLELDPHSDARFSYNAQGYFTDVDDPNRPKKALGDKLLERLELEPNSLLERALGNLAISDLRVDLFNKNLPETPMRIQLAGVADAGNAEIPLNITTNVNGTVAELLNFLMRLDSLGLVAE